MHLDSGMFLTVALFFASNTGALIYFVGKCTARLEDHGRRITDNETQIAEVSRLAFQLVGKEGVK